MKAKQKHLHDGAWYVTCSHALLQNGASFPHGQDVVPSAILMPSFMQRQQLPLHLMSSMVQLSRRHAMANAIVISMTCPFPATRSF